MPEFKPFNLADSIGAAQSAAMNNFRLNEAAHGVQARDALSQAVSAGTPEAMNQYKSQFPAEAMAYEEGNLDLQTKRLQAAMTQNNMITYLAQGATDDASYQRSLATAKKMGLPVDDAPPTWEQGGKQYTEQALQQSLSLKDRISLYIQRIKAEKDNSQTRGEYIVPVNTAEGVYGFDTRRGRYVDPVTGQSVTKPLIRSQDDPTLQGALTGTKQQSETAGKLYNETVENALKISDQVELAKEGINKLVKYSQSTAGGTGPFATVGGIKRYTDAELQDLEATFNKINLKNLVVTFSGFSRSIDTNVEREAWNRTQPGIKLDDPVNMNILIGNISLGVKAAAEAEARQKYIEASPKKNLEGYRSPILGKTKVLFNPDGEAQIVPNEQIRELRRQGWMDSDQYAKRAMQNKPKSSSEKTPTTPQVKFLGFE